MYGHRVRNAWWTERSAALDNLVAIGELELSSWLRAASRPEGESVLERR
jgi:hypothetical protein